VIPLCGFVDDFLYMQIVIDRILDLNV
jgi:uncharacterized membrane protein YkvA (DUF1232 family)